MTWFQAAFDPEAPHGTQWVVIRFWRHGPTGRDLSSYEHSRWPTRHEAEGHARKAWEQLQ